MGTISTNLFLDENVATVTAGEAWTINSGAKLTVRTDSRLHAKMPASFVGSMGSVTLNEGELVWDSTAIRWLPFDSGTGNVPATIGVTITQGGVSGYLLGVWSAINSAPLAGNSAMPVTGFIKFREVTGGNFVAGALTGIGASATGPDVQGWMEVVHDASANITVPRLGKHTIRGGRFSLATTTGVRGQTFQIPTMGSAVQLAPGMFVETAVGSDEYEFWPGLNGTGNGWSYVHVGNATGTTDVRQKFLKATAGGVLTMGETWSVAGTYASLAAQASTYAGLVHTSAYTWVNDVVEVYYASGHLLETGQQTGLDFTSGGAMAYDGIYTVTVLDPYHFTVPLAGSGAPGAVTSRPGITVTFTAHGQHIGEQVYCDFTTGTGVDGAYEVYAVPSANTYLIKYPSAVAVTSGAASVLHTLVLTYTAHGLAVGQTVYCDFTSGTGVDGVYVAKVIATNTLNVNFPHSATTSGNVTLSRDIGYVAQAGLRTWIPSTILAECATAARATNTIPNATIATRPEWTTTSAGALDFEYLYCTSGYFNVTQPYSVRVRNMVAVDSVILAECATPVDMEGIYVGMLGGLDAQTLGVSTCFAGGSIKKVKAMRGNAPGTTDHATAFTYCKGLVVDDLEAGIIQYARSTGMSIAVATCDGLTFNRPRVINQKMTISGSPNITINNIDYNERLNGHGLAANYAISTDANCHNLVINGMTQGHNNTVPNQQPYAPLYTIGCANVKLRNIGTLAAPLPLPTWAKNLTATVYVYQSGGSNNTVKVQKCFIGGVRTAPFATVNSDKNMLYESIRSGNYSWSSKALLATAHADLNATVKNVQEVLGTTGQASVYGTHFMDTPLGTGYGRLTLAGNEATAETAAYFTNNFGTAKFNSSGGVLVYSALNSSTWTTPHFIKGYTGFQLAEVVMSGGTLTNYSISYTLDNGSGYGATRSAYITASTCTGVSGQYTITALYTTTLKVGMYCFGTGLSVAGLGCKNAAIPRITEINNSTTFTVDIPNASTVSGTLRFTELPNEVIDPSIGFKMKLRIQATSSNSTAITFLSMGMLTTAAAQDNYYPLDTNALTISGIVPGSDVVIRESGTTNVLASVDNLSATTWNYEYETSKNVDVSVFKSGYMPYTSIKNYTLPLSNNSLLVNQTEDVSYLL